MADSLSLRVKFQDLQATKDLVEVKEDELDTLLAPIIDAWPEKWGSCTACYWIPDHADEKRFFARVTCSWCGDGGSIGIPWEFVDNMAEEADTDG